MEFGRENPTPRGSVAIVPAAGYHIAIYESRPVNLERRVCSKEVTDHQSEGELDLNNMDN